MRQLASLLIAQDRRCINDPECSVLLSTGGSVFELRGTMSYLLFCHTRSMKSHQSRTLGDLNMKIVEEESGKKRRFQVQAPPIVNGFFKLMRIQIRIVSATNKLFTKVAE